ncbi:G2/mitotic-specific cyclin S13-7-like isoform X2 [Lotus japonicus]|uniref:G2/mitotic-specific cyclin S13-7-like isoform X2 n=1 Tax=Lotus japonicus TaxID=34305 RepID=UPI0025871A9D|nr:G2/mitotic-specific cyclin S13-7-like isoform X2 [Lotus japonicus]
MENRSRGRGKAKEEAGQGNRQVLGDIGNLEVLRNAEGKQISRPITRNFHTKLLASAQAAANLVVQANEQGTPLGKKRVIVTTLDNGGIVHKQSGVQDLTQKPNPDPVDMVSSDDFVCEMKCEISRRNVQTLSSTLNAQSKAASGVVAEPADQPVEIDAENANNELAVIEYLDELYKFYKQTEGDSRVSDYMKSQHEINEKMRSITVDWLLEVHNRFKLMPETLYLTINILDRYLSSTDIPKKELQLVGISSMLIACKYEEIYPPQMIDLVSISNDAYTKHQIHSMERSILEKLQWYLTVPTPYVFLVRLSSVQPDKQMENLAFFLAELTLEHYQAIVSYSPSTIAASAIYAARCTLNRRPFWSETLKRLSSYCTEQIIECAKLLVSLQTSAADSKPNALYWKFSSEDKGFVALLPPTKNIENQLLM